MLCSSDADHFKSNNFFNFETKANKYCYITCIVVYIYVLALKTVLS